MPSTLRHPAIDAALSTATALLGMEVVFVTGLTDTDLRFERVRGADWPGLGEGLTVQRSDSLCERMLDGAPAATADAAADPAYADAAARATLGIRSYVGVPIARTDGTIVGTLCGIDRGEVVVGDAAVGVLRELAGIVAAHLGTADPPSVVIRRTPDGWAVGEEGESEQDLTAAMVLADLLHDDLAPGVRPARPEDDLDEVARLRLAIAQLEHALAARVAVEQAIGILAERFGVAPKDAFDRLRRIARRSGLRVHDLSRDIVASATAPETPLPADLERG